MEFRAPPTQPAADDAGFLPLPSLPPLASPGGDGGDEAVGTGTVSTLGRIGDAARDGCCSGAAGGASPSGGLCPPSTGLPSDKLLSWSPAKGLPNPPGGLSARARRAAMRTFLSGMASAGAAAFCFSGAGGFASFSAGGAVAACSASSSPGCDGGFGAGSCSKSSTSTIGEASTGTGTGGATGAATGSGSCGSNGGGGGGDGGGSAACGTTAAVLLSSTTTGTAGARALGSSPFSARACPRTRSTSSRKRCSVAAAAPVCAAPAAARIASTLLCVTRRAVSSDASAVATSFLAECSSSEAANAPSNAASACGVHVLVLEPCIVHPNQKHWLYLGGRCFGVSSSLFICTLRLGGQGGGEFRVR